MSNKHKRWTTTEDSKLVDQVKVSPQNLRRAFLRASEEIDRTPGACAYRWYTSLSKDYERNPNTVCFAVFSKKRYGINRKNCIKESTVNANKGIWNYIIHFIKNLTR